jgi:hypothetical protein
VKGTRAGIAAALLLAPLALSACRDEGQVPPADIPFLTADGHYRIGAHSITVPMVALRRTGHAFTLNREKPAKSRKEILMEQATDPDNPMPVERLSLEIHQYQMRDAYGASMEICPRLTRLWAQVVCRGEHRGLLKRLPETFDLVDRAKMDILPHHFYAGAELVSQYDQIKHMALQPGVTEIGCTKETEFCTAVVEALPGLLAVWTAGSDERGTVEQQGQAIVEFVRRAIGPTEDRTLVTTD